MLDPIAFTTQLTSAELTFVQGIADHTYTDGQLIIGNGLTGGTSIATLTAGSGVTITNGHGTITIAATSGGGSVTSVSVVSANGFAGTVATATTTPAITLSTTITGIIKGNGTAISAATDGTDYLSSSTGVLLTNVTTTATASKIAQRDSSANLLANNFVSGYATTVTAAGTTTLTVASGHTQVFTGTTTQTVVLPDATTLALGFEFRIVNNSTGLVTVQTNGGATLWTLGASSDVLLINTSISTAAGTWDVHYLATGIATGKKLSFANSLNFSGTDGSSVAFGTGGTVTYTSNNLSVFAATTSAQLAGVISDETGTGALVFATSPTLVTPTLGVATATTINKVTLTAPATGSTLTIADGKTLTASNSLTLAGTDSTTMTFPSSSATVAGLGIAQTFTNANTFNVALTIASGASVTWRDLYVQAATTTVTGTTGITTAAGFNKIEIGQPTISDSSAVTITTAATMAILGAPTIASSAVVTNVYGLNVGGAATIANAASTTYAAINVPAHTLTLSATTQITSTNAIADVALGQITVNQSGGAVTVNSAASLYIANAPAAGSSVTITNAYALWVGAGAVNFGGTLSVTGHVTLEGVTSTGATGTGKIVFSIAPAITGAATADIWKPNNNAVTVTANAGTCSAAFELNTFTNSSAATMAITLSTSGAVDGQKMIVRIYDASAATQTIGWTNTENSTVSAPTTSNGSTTLPLTVGFIYNGSTSKWRCVASA